MGARRSQLERGMPPAGDWFSRASLSLPAIAVGPQIDLFMPDRHPQPLDPDRPPQPLDMAIGKAAPLRYSDLFGQSLCAGKVFADARCRFRTSDILLVRQTVMYPTCTARQGFWKSENQVSAFFSAGSFGQPAAKCLAIWGPTTRVGSVAYGWGTSARDGVRGMPHRAVGGMPPRFLDCV